MIRLRVDARQRALIRRAASVLAFSPSEFILESACHEAESILLERCYSSLSRDVFERFEATIRKPPRDNPKLRRLLRTRAPWEA